MFKILNESDDPFPSAPFASPDSVDYDIITSGVAGDGVLDGCLVTGSGAATVSVSAGRALIGGAVIDVAAVAVAITAGHATLNRLDLVVVDNTGTVSVVAGAPATNQTVKFPAVPDGSVVLAAVWQPAAGTNVAANQVLDKRVQVRDDADVGAPSFPAPASSTSPARPTRKFTPSPLPPEDFDVTFRQKFKVLSDIEEWGCRRSTVDSDQNTAGYLTATRLSVLGGAFNAYPSANNPASRAGIVIPAEGILPRDEMTVSMKVGNFMGSDFVAAAFPGVQRIAVVGSWLINRQTASTVTVTDFTTFQSVTLTITAGAWANQTWRTLSIRWQDTPGTLEAWWDADYANRAVSVAPTGHNNQNAPQPGPSTNTVEAWLAGLHIGTGLQVALLYVADLTVYRWMHTADAVRTAQGPTLTVDLDTNTGVWPDNIGGALGLYQGFQASPEVDPDKSIRDKQFDLVFGDAGMRFMRSPLGLNDVIATGSSPSFVYDWTAVDEKLSALAAHPNGRYLFTLGYTPTNLVPPGGDTRDPPSNFDAWAVMAVDLATRIKGALGAQVAGFSFWNEPDIANYFNGTLTQAFDLWKRTQNRFIAVYPTDPSMRMGSPEFAKVSSHLDFTSRLATESAGLKASVQQIIHHSFSQDIATVVYDLELIRGYYTGAGLAPTVPIWLTEYALRNIDAERYNDPTSWWWTQPNPWTTPFIAAFVVAMNYWLERHPTLHVEATGLSSIGSSAYWWGTQALVTSDTDPRPLPALSAIAALNRLEGTRLDVSPNWPGIVGLATERDDGAVVVVYGNYKPYRGYIDTQTFDLEWVGSLPTGARGLRWTHEQYDWRSPGPRLNTVAAGDAHNVPSRITVGNLGIGVLTLVPV